MIDGDLKRSGPPRARRIQQPLLVAFLLLIGGLFLDGAEARSLPERTLPLDIPVPLSGESSGRPYGLIERPQGIYLYRSDSGQVLALLPRLAIGSVIAGLKGERLDNPQVLELPPMVEVLPGWPLYLQADPSGPPAVADVTGDGEPEILLALVNGSVHAIDAAGTEVPGWPVSLEDPIHDGPALADLNRDGRPEVLVSTAGGFAHALTGAGASELPGWPVCLEGLAPDEELWAAPAADEPASRDETEIALAGTAGTLQVFNADGALRPGWPVRYGALSHPSNPAACFACPRLIDLDGDGSPEIVAGLNSGVLAVTGPRGTPAPGWPRQLPGHARAGFGRVSTADLDGDGQIELIVATDRGFPGPPRLCVFRRDGEPRPGWPIELPGPVNGGVAVADLDGNGHPDLIVAGIGGDGQIGAYDADGAPLAGWPRRFEGMSFDAGPVVADFDGKPGLEIALLGSVADHGSVSRLYLLDARGNLFPGFPIEMEGSDGYAGGLAVADLDQDGSTELIVATGGDARITVYGFPGRARPESMPWPRSGWGPRIAPGAPGPPGSAPSPAGPASNGARQPAEVEAIPLPGGLSASLDPRSTLTFVLHRAASVRLMVLNVQGETVDTVMTGSLPQGLYAMTWDGKNDAGAPFPTGVYFFQLEVDGKVRTKQLLLLLR